MLESFRETREDAEAVFKEDLLNKYVKNRLSEDMFSLNTATNNSIISTASKVSKGYNLNLGITYTQILKFLVQLRELHQNSVEEIPS